MDAEEILSLLDEQDGEHHCPVSNCDVWYPDGVQYGFLDHFGDHDVCLICERGLKHPRNEFLCIECADEFDGENQ